jgi:hypothetical protein
VKHYLIHLTTLSPPLLGNPLLLYVSTSHSAVSVALVQKKVEGEIKKQAPVYFVSQVLGPSKKNYTEIEKVLYVVLMASRMIQHYFQSYNIIVPSSQPRKSTIRNREAMRRIGKWATELNEFVIDFVHRPSIPFHALADFITEWTPEDQDKTFVQENEIWTIFYDGSWGTFGVGAIAILISTSKIRTSYATKLEFLVHKQHCQVQSYAFGPLKT